VAWYDKFRALWGQRSATFNAYGRVFEGTGSEADANVVLKDLAKFCGYFDTPMMTSPETRTVDPYASMYAMGKKAVIERIIAQINTSGDVSMQTRLHARLMEQVEMSEDNGNVDFS
jgi:hypothetical protein